VNAELWVGGGVLGAVFAGIQILYRMIQDARGGNVRRSRAEAAKMTLDVSQAEQSLPHVTEALRLGNVADAVAVQQQVINGLRDHAAWQDEQLRSRDAEIVDLRRRLTDRDARIEELEARVDVAERSLSSARAIIEELRQTSRTENDTHNPHQ
jgi:chromosome segregation ATPase